MECFSFRPSHTEGCTVTAWLQNQPNMDGCAPRLLPAVVICPGGGYAYVSAREADPIAKPYFAAGYHVFLLEYTTGEGAKDFTPLWQLASAMLYIREHAAQWLLDAEKIAVCGFSAGGHLAASLGTLYHDGKFLNTVRARWGISPDPARIRPDAMILGYPVILADAFAHKGSLELVSGSPEGSAGYAYFGLDQHVDADTPPTFLWHTATDGRVPVENSLRFALSLSAARVPFELHVLPTGGHGMSVCTREVNSEDPYNARWMEWSIRWLSKTFSFHT